MYRGRMEAGPVDSMTFYFKDIWGRQKVNNPNFKDGMNPHIWICDGKPAWYVFKPRQEHYQTLSGVLEDYLSVFQPELLQQENQQQTMQ